MEHYVKTGSVKRADTFLGKGLVDFSARRKQLLLGSVINSAERFIVAHEIAHALLDHTKSSARGASPVLSTQEKQFSGRVEEAKQYIEVINPDHFDEYCADALGFMLTLQAACGSQANKDFHCAMACAGCVIFLGILLLVEYISKYLGIRIEDSHPPAFNRLYILQLLIQIEGYHERAFLNPGVPQFVQDIGRHFPGFEMPPPLDRDMNRIALPVLAHLGRKLDNVPFIMEGI